MAKVRLGAVEYTSKDGFTKLALVIGTRKSTAKETGVTRPEKGNANLLVFSPKSGEGKTYTRWNVPQGEGPGTWRPIKNTSDVDVDATELADSFA